ncbi:MAG TPA: nucleotide disphospho-sugar-binding domain-containing protein [Ktedonobacterales bacterium]
MGRILAYTTPARGHLYPLVPILDELRRRGHQVALRTLAADVPLMVEHGFAAAPISERIESMRHDDWSAGNPRAALARSLQVLAARAEYEVADVRRAIEVERPDVLLVDINAWGALGAAEAWGGPWAAYSPFPLALSSVDAPPFGPGLPPARGPLGHLRDRLLRPLVLGMIERTVLPPLNTVRARIQLPPLATSTDFYRCPPLLLLLTAEPFEYPRHDWPANVALVGPCDWDPPAAAPDWLAGITQPIVLVTTSTEYQNDGRLIETAFAALADEPVAVVATMPAGDPARLRVPNNAHVERFIPHGLVLERAVCAITHGGMGATQKALRRGVPVCVVPFGRDQLEVARRVVVARAGTRLAARRLRPDRLRASVRAAMTMTTGARRVAEAFRAAGGPVAAADAIEARLRLPTATTPAS